MRRGELYLTPVAAGAENLGMLVFRPSHPLVDADQRILERAALVTALLLLLLAGEERGGQDGFVGGDEARGEDLLLQVARQIEKAKPEWFDQSAPLNVATAG